MNCRVILLVLLCVASAAALDVQVQLNAPKSILPGEAANFSVSATLDNVTIISFPANASITFPDGTTAPLQLTDTLQGSYQGTIYSVIEGNHVITAQVTLDGQPYLATATVSVQKPKASVTINASLTDGIVSGAVTQDTPGVFTLDFTPFIAGDLSTKQYTSQCTFSCDTSCTFSCPAPQQAQIARFSTKKAYTYTYYIPVGTGNPSTNVTYDEVTGVDEPEQLLLSTPAEAFTLFGSMLNQIAIIGGNYEFTPTVAGDGSIIIKDGDALESLPLSVIVRDNVQQFSPEAASDADSWWYGFVSTDKQVLLKLPQDPGLHEAYLLENSTRTQLSWLKSYVVVPPSTGWVEIKRSLPGISQVSESTDYGLMVGGAGLQRHEFPGSIEAIDSSLSSIPVYYNGSTSVFYTQDQYAAAVLNTDGTLSVTQPLRMNTQGSISYDVQGNSTTDTVFSIFTLNGTSMQRFTFSGSTGTRDVLFTVPPGAYIAVARGLTSAATGLRVYSDQAGITFDQNQTISAQQNTQVNITHLITNNDLENPLTVELQANSTFAVLIKATDTNNNGIVDITVQPGATASFTATVLVPAEGTSSSVCFNATVQGTNISSLVQDSIIVQAGAAPTYTDADVVSIQGTMDLPVVQIQDNDQTQLLGTLYITGENLSTQLAVTLSPGLNNISVPAAGHRITARLLVPGDTAAENNERTRDFRSPFSTRMVHINERLHSDHTKYTVQLPATPGYKLVWIDENGGEREATAELQGTTTLWSLGPLSANSEFYAALVAGEPVEEKLATLVDNSEPSVTKQGSWVSAIATPGYIGFDYFTDLNLEKNGAVTYAPGLWHDMYGVAMYTPADPSFDDAVPVTISGLTFGTITVNEQQGGWQYLGLYELDQNSSVKIENHHTAGFVIADALEFTPISQFGGLEIAGNSSFGFQGVIGQPITIDTGAYLTSIVTIDAPDMNFSQNASKLVLTPLAIGTLTAVVSDGERTLTITIDVASGTHLELSLPSSVAESPVVVGEPVTWTATVPVQDNATAAVVSLPDTVLDVSVNATTDSGTQTLASGDLTVIEDNQTKPLQQAVLENTIDDLKRQQDNALASDAAPASGSSAGELNVTIQETQDALTQAAQTQPAAVPAEEIPVNVPDNATVMHVDVPENTKELTVTYTTGAPVMTVDNVSATEQSITVSADTHYENITAFLDITPSPKDAIHLVRTTDGIEEPVNLTYIDADADGLIERIQWVVPHLSDQTYELTLTVLNPVTTLRNGDIWTIYFNTTGTGNLTFWSNNSAWEEMLYDLPTTHDEMKFLNLTCGDQSLLDQLYVIDSSGAAHKYSSIDPIDSIKPVQFLIPDYSCNDTAALSNYMNIAGYAIIDFEFSSQNMSVFDRALDPPPSMAWIDPTLPNNSMSLAGYFVMNISANDTNLTNFAFRWNGTGVTWTNLTLYDNTTTLLHMNLDNISAIGENATKAVDTSRFGNNGSFVGAVTWTTLGMWDGAVNLTAIGRLVNITNTSSINSPTNAVTVSAWAKAASFTNAASGNDENPIILKGTIMVTGSLHNNYTYWIDNRYVTASTATPIFSIACSTGGTIATVTGTAGSINTNWHHYTLTYNGTTLTAYVDGTSIGTSAACTGLNLYPATTNNLLIGYGYDDRLTRTRGFTGTIDEVRVYNRSLNDSEVQDLYVSNLQKADNSSWYFWSNQSGLTFCGNYSTEGTGIDKDSTKNTTGIYNYSYCDTPPTQATPILNSSDDPLNLTTGVLLLYNQSTYDPDGINPVKNIVVWKINNTPYAVMQTPFVGGTSNSTYTKDYSGTSDGTVNSSTYNATGGPDSRGSYIFSGNPGSYIKFDYAPRANISKPPISVTAWVRLNSINLDQKVVSKRPSWVLAVYTDNQVEFEMFNNTVSSLTLGSNFRNIAGTALAANQWYFIVGTWDGRNLRTYVNGTLDATQTYNYNTVDTTIYNVTIGKTADAWNNWFAGQIADVRVYDRNISAGEMAQIYKEGLNVSTQQLMNNTQTTSQDNWSACITPDDSYFDGAEACSNSVFVNGIVAPINTPNGTVVDRDHVSHGADATSILLNVTAYGDQGIPVTFYANVSSPSIPGQTNIWLGNNTTDLNGMAAITFSPNSTTFAGNYTWWPSSSKAATAGIGDFLVKGGTNLTYWNTSFYPNASYTMNQSVDIRVNITSAGGPETKDNMSLYGLSVNSTVKNTSSGANTSFASYTSPYWNASHVPTMLGGPGNWNDTVNVTSPYWYSNQTNDTFVMYGYMNVTANTTSPSSIFPYQNTTASCTVLDEDTNYAVNAATVSFYRNGTLIGTNTTNTSGIAQYAFQTNNTGTYTITCNVTDQLGIFYYKGRAPEQNGTLTVNPYPITPASPANGTIVDRDSVNAVDPDIITLNLTVPSYVPNGVPINFTANISNPAGIIPSQANILLGNNTTNSGSVILYYNPNSTSYAGNWSWFGMNPNAYSNGTNIYTSKGGLNSTYNSSLNPNSTYFENDTVTTELNITSLGPENRSALNSSYVLSASNTFQNTTGSTSTIGLLYNGTLWRNNTFTILTLKGVGVWNTTANASGTYFYMNSTNRTTTVYGYMNVTANNTNPSSIFIYQNTTTTCTVLDEDTSYAVNGATVSFYRNGTLLGTNNTNTSGIAQYAFQTNTTGTYTITCNVTDQPGIYYYRGRAPEQNGTLTVNPFPMTPSSPANGTIVDRDGVSAADPDIITLNLTVPNYVPNGVMVNFTANLTSPAGIIPSQTSIQLGNNTTSSGSAIIYYDPTSASYAGNWSWYGVSQNATANGSNNYISKGSFNTTFNSALNPNSTYYQNDTVTTEVNVTSNGPENRSALNASYLITETDTFQNTTSSTGSVTGLYNGTFWRNNTFTILTLKGAGIWNITANSSSSFFYSNWTNRSLTVYGYMNVTANSTSPSSIFAFQTTVTTCTVLDEDTNYAVNGATVSFYRNGTLIGTNNTNSSGIAQYGYQVNTTGTYTITCNVTDQPGIYYLKGRAPEQNATLTVNPYPITPIGAANGTVVDRDSVNAGDPDFIVLNVSVPAYVPAGTVVNFTANLTSPALAGQSYVVIGNNTTSGTNAILYYNPNATSYAGNWTWWGNNTAGTLNGTMNFVSKGALSLVYNSTLNPNSTYYENDTAKIVLNVTSQGPETNDQLNSSYTLSTNNTIQNTTSSTNTISLSYTSPYWNGTHNLQNLKGAGVWNATANSSGTYFYMNSTNRTFIVYGYMNVTSNSTNPSSIFVYGSTTTTCGVQDQYTNYTVQNANVAFYRNGTLIGTNTTNTSGIAQYGYQVNSTGTWTITCNVTDQPGIYYYRGLAPEQNGTLTVNPYPITPASPVNGTKVDRDAVSGGADPIVITLNVTVPAYVPNGTQINFTANLTDPVIGGQTNIIIGNNSTSSGSAILYYNPNSTSYAGNWSWFGVNPNGYSNGTNNYISKGGLNSTYNGTLNPNSTYYENATVTTETNVTSLGPESTNQLNTSYLISANNTFQNTTGSTSTVGLLYNGTFWRNNTFTILTLKGAGIWNTTANTSGTYFYMNSTNRTITVYGYMNITTNNTNPSSIFAYQSTTTTCTVLDEDTNYAVNAATVSFYKNGTLIGTNNTNSSGIAQYGYQVNNTGTYTITCNVTDQPGIYYLKGRAPEQNATLTVNPFPITITNPANGTIIDRDGRSGGADQQSAVLIASVPNYIPTGTPIDFRGNLTLPAGILPSQVNVFFGNNTTNSSGQTTTSFNPDSAIYAGNWSWFGNNTNGITNNSLFIIIKGGLNITYRNNTYNPNASYNQTNTAIVETNVTSNGPENVSALNSSYNIAVNSSVWNASNSFVSSTQSFTNPYWNTTHLLSQLFGVGTWNSTIAVSSTFWYSNATNRTFTVYGFMNVTSNTTNPNTATIYQPITTTCGVQDQLSNYSVNAATVSFFRNGTLLGTNNTNSSGLATYSYTINSTGTYVISCSVADQPAIFYYAGSQPSGNNTLTIVPYPIATSSPANGTIVDRDSVNAGDPDIITLNLTVPAYVPNGIMLNFTANLTDPVIGGQTNILLGNNTTTSGSAILYYNPNASSYAGNWSWFGTSLNGTENSTLSFISKGGLNSTYKSSLNPNSTYYQNDTITTETNITSLGPENTNQLNSSYLITANNTFQNTTASTSTIGLLYNGTLWRNNTFTILTLKGVGIWNTTTNTSGPYFYMNSTNRTTTVYGYMNITSNITSPSSIFAFQTTTTTCGVQDEDTNYSVNGAIVSFYRNGTLLGTNTTNTSGIAQYGYQVNLTGTWTITCNVTDQPGIYYYRGRAPEQNGTLTVNPFPMTPTSPANGTPVDRDGSNAAVADIITLNVTVPGYVPAGTPINFTANLTSPAGLGQTNVILGNNTTSGTNAILYYNPNAISYAGNWTWWGNNTAGTLNGTLTFLSYGTLNVTYANNTTDPNATYNKPTNVTIGATLASWGFESTSLLNASYAPTLNATLNIPNGTNTTLALSYNTSAWNNSYQILPPDPRGTWNTVLNGSATWFYTNTTANRTFYVNDYPPTQGAPILNATDNPLNRTTANLTAYNQSTSDAENDPVTNVWAWTVNGIPYSTLTMPFDSNVSNTSTGAVRDYATGTNGTLGGGTLLNMPTWTVGKVGGAYSFDGTNSYIGNISLGAAGLQNWTETAWVKTGSNAAGIIITNRIVPATEVSNSLHIGWWAGAATNDGLAYFSNDGPGCEFGAVGSTNVANGSWHFIVGRRTVDSSGISSYSVFVDGRLEGTDNKQVGVGCQNIAANSTKQWDIGWGPGWTVHFNGTIDDMRIYNRSLGADQIYEQYLEANNSISTSTVVSNETRVNDIWQTCDTPNDGMLDGTTACSNTLQVIGVDSPTTPANDTKIDRDSYSPVDPDSANLTATTYGDSGVNVSFYANLTSPAIGGQTNLLLGTAISNSSGYATLSFNPDSTYYAGNYTWWPNATNSTTIGTATIIIKGAPLAAYQSSLNPNSTYYENDTITTALNVTSPGPESTNTLNASYALSINNTFQNSTGSLATVGLLYNGSQWVNNTFTILTLKGVGVWNTTANVSGAYFYANATNRTFTVSGYMNITSNITSPASIFAYQFTTTACTVQDEDTNYTITNANVSFYRNGTLVGTNLTNTSGAAQYAFQTNNTGTYTITCNVTNQPGIYYYRGRSPEQNGTLTVQPFPINDTSPANGTIVDRDSANAIDPDIIALNVTVPAYVPNGVTINFTANLTDPALGQSNILLGNNTTNSGVAVLYYNPNSTSYAGNWTWFGNNSAGTQGTLLNFISKGGLNSTYNSALNPNSTYYENDTITTETNITSLGTENTNQLNSSYLITANNTFQNTTGSTSTIGLLYNGTLWRNNTFTILTLKGAGVWNTTANVSGAYFYANATNRTFTVSGYMNITSNSTSPSSIFAFQTTVTTCTVLDEDTNYAVNGATVSFYRNGTLIGTNTTNTSGITQYGYQVNTTGTYTITCNVTDQPGIYYYRGRAPEQNGTLTVTPFPITVVTPANGTVVDRDAASGGIDPQVILLNVTVPNYVPSGVTINFTANLTNPAVAGQSYTLLGNNTTSGANALLYYNPNSTSYAGNWTWWGNNSAGTQNGTLNFISKGSLNLVFRNNTYNPNASYNETDTIIVESNLTSNGPETSDQLNSTYGATVRTNMTNPVNASALSALGYVSPYWNGSFPIATLAGVGNWTSYLLSNATFFYDKNSTNRTIAVYGQSNVTNISLSASTIYAYQTTTGYCAVVDALTGTPAQGYNVTYWRNSTNLGFNTTNSSGFSQYSFQTNISGTYSVNCTITDDLSRYYYALQNNINTTLIVNKYPITPVSPANGTIVDRDNASSGADPTVVVLNLTVPGVVPNGVTINFTANITNPAIGGQTNVLLGTNNTSAGNAVLYFDPNSTFYAGNWSWFGLESQGTANGTLNLIAKGSYNMSYNSALNPNSTYYENDTITTETNLTSNGPETKDQLNANYSAIVNNTFQNTTASTSVVGLLYNGTLWRNNTFAILTLKGPGIWNTTASSAASYFYTPNSTNRTFNVYGFMNLTSNATNPSTIYAFQSTTTACGVQNEYTGYNVQNANVTFYRNGTFLGNNTTNTSGMAVLSYQVNNTGTWTITCNVTDQPNIYYYRGLQPEQNGTLTVLPFPITPQNPANDTLVDRDKVNAAVADNITLVGQTISGVPDGVLIDIWANLTDPAGILPSQTNLHIGNNTTNATYINFTFLPNSTIYAGNYTWWMNSSGGVPNGTSTYSMIGGANVTFATSQNPNSQYNETDTALFSLNITSYGPENTTTLNSTYHAATNLTLVTPVNGTLYQNTTFNGSTWNSSQYLYGFGPGVWNTSANLSARYFFPLNYTLRNFTVFGFINMSTWDSEEQYNGTVWANIPGHYFANVTNSFGQPLSGANCTLGFYDRNNSMLYNNSDLLFENATALSVEGIVRYNVTCSQQFYNTNSASGNVSVHSSVNVSLMMNASELAAHLWQVTMNVTNLQNYTQHDIYVYHLVPIGFSVNYTTAIYDTQFIQGGMFSGNSTQWRIPNLTAGQSTLIRYNASGSDNITALYQAALKVRTMNTSIIH